MISSLYDYNMIIKYSDVNHVEFCSRNEPFPRLFGDGRWAKREDTMDIDP